MFREEVKPGGEINMRTWALSKTCTNLKSSMEWRSDAQSILFLKVRMSQKSWIISNSQVAHIRVTFKYCCSRSFDPFSAVLGTC